MRPTRPFRIRRLARILLAASVTLAGGAVVATVTTGTAVAAPQATGEFNYAEALQDSMLFYEIQRSGKLPADNRVSWRGDSDLTDGADVGLDLTGGYHDAGDEVKFGLPAAYTMTTLAWGGIVNNAGYVKSGQLTYLLRNLRWGDDYIMRAHPSPHVFYAQVGTGSADHNFWGPAEVAPTARPAFAVTESCPGSDVVGQSSAALAASSILFQSSDPSYSAKLLAQAKSLYEFADNFRGTYDACISDVSQFYKSWSGYWDELVWGALWLYKATGDNSYLTKAINYFPNLGKANQSTTPKYAYTVSWDDTTFASYVLLAEITGDQQYIDDAERNLDWLTTGYNGARANYTTGGEVQVDVWGVARYAADAAFTAMEFGNFLKSRGLDSARQKTYHDFAVQQINYILGDNPNHESYEVGFTNSGTSTKWPQFVHHRTAHGSWDQSMSDPPSTRHTAYGLLVGGPTGGTDSFSDDRQQYQQTEGALDYNALFSGVLAGLVTEFGGTPRDNFPPKETPDGPEMFVGAAVNQSSTNFIEIKSQVYNKSGWPARDLINGHLRYYFTLDPGETISQVTVNFVYHECPAVSLQPFSGNVYYVDVDCTGQHVAPAGQSQYHRENQFRVTFPAAHDYTKDWSFAGVAPAGSSPVTVTNIALYDGGTKVWGNDPGPSTPVTPPSAPGTPAASNITATGATLSWAAATAGTNAIGGYDVYRVGTTDTVVASTTGALTANVTGLAGATTYSFYVKARDTAGNAGNASATVSLTTATPPPTTPPGAPGTLSASNLTSTGVTLAWGASTPGTNPIAKYVVYQTGSTGNTPLASTANGSTTTLALTGLSPSVSYSFFVVAQDSTGVQSAHSNTVNVTTPAPPAGGACTVTYSVNDWGGGFTANITVTNTGGTAINGWTLAFSYAGNQTVTQGWSATWSQSGKNVTATALSWNASLAPGGSTNIGFNGSYSGPNLAPTAFTLNGVACN
jgi:endoglucanase